MARTDDLERADAVFGAHDVKVAAQIGEREQAGGVVVFDYQNGGHRRLLFSV